MSYCDSNCRSSSHIRNPVQLCGLQCNHYTVRILNRNAYWKCFSTGHTHALGAQEGAKHRVDRFTADHHGSTILDGTMYCLQTTIN